MIIIILLEPNLCSVRAAQKMLVMDSSVDIPRVRCVLQSRCLKCALDHIPAVFYVHYENWVDKESWHSYGIRKTYNKILFIRLMAQFAI